jgi:hypothetical protein
MAGRSMDDRERDEQGRAQKAQDLTDFNNELAGRDVGRLRRFLPSTEASSVERTRREQDDRFFWMVASLTLQARQRLLAERLEVLDCVSIRALNEAERRLERAADALELLRRNATLDERGRRVYRRADGQAAFFEDGRQLTGEECQAVIFREGASTWEEHLEATGSLEHATQERNAIGVYRDRLHTAQARLAGGTPLSEAELTELEQGAEAMPDSVSRELALGVLERSSDPSSSTASDLPIPPGVRSRVQP